MRILPQKFFDRPTLAVASDLIGCTLARKMPGGTIERRIITETEAYDGERDLACHASRGQTARNTVMYGPAGRWYVYFTYGMHWMLNIVVGKCGYPAAVLIRGVEGLPGPARLTKALRIDKKLNEKKATHSSGLWIEARPKNWRGKIVRAKRIGVDYAGPIWSAKKWRFSLKQKMPKKP